ncbi:MAG TPA: DUF1206 domain-containing protein [Acidimicrobiales bacterium]|nr:DUF1206 domain-containing protein [Acidimicrobiales bacterium]
MGAGSSSSSSKASDVKDQCEDAVETVADSPWLEGLTRWGLAVRGGMYLLVALLALRVATGDGNERADKHGALQAVSHQPLGRVLLALAAIGFAGYALWRFTEAVVGERHEKNRRKAVLRRVGCAARGVLYCVLFAATLRYVVSADEKPGSGNAEADWTARVLEWPGGTWLVALVGIGVIGGGLYVGWRGLSEKFRKRLDESEMSRAERRWISRFGVVGMIARMAVFTLIGVFLTGAALRHDPREAVGIDGALKRLASGSYGPLLLGCLAAGLAAYGLYCLAEARYRDVEPRS